jgi:NAD(P)-dependent dehydrogenase (short-subunit alcohol dehydrogenase family)
MSSQGPRGVKERPRALVTGGAARVGRAVALALAREGIHVAIAYHRAAAAARRTRRDLEALGVRAVALRADLGSPAAARRLVGEATAALGGLEILVNNAALFAPAPLETVTPAVYDRFLSLNLGGAFFCAQAAAALMGRRGGHIVNMGDAAEGAAWPRHIPYALSKAGLVALTRSLAVALRPRRIAVNCVAPGAVLRPAGLSPARWRRLARGYEGSAEDVAAAVVFFATCPPYITGQVLAVDGGAGG